MSQDTHALNLDEGKPLDDIITGKINFWVVTAVGGAIATAVIMPKATVVLLVVFALMGLVRLWSAPQRLRTFIAVPGILTVLLFVGFTVWMTVSIGWHFAGDGKVMQALHTIVLFLIGFAALITPVPSNRNLRRAIGYGVCIGYISACAVIAAAILYVMTGHEEFWGSYFDDPLSTLNNRVVMVALMLLPVLLFFRNARHGWHVFLFFTVIGILAFSSSLASVAAVLVGTIGMTFRYFWGRSAVIGIALLVAATTVSAPYCLRAVNADRFASPEIMMDDSQLLPTSARHRLAIWSFAADRIQEKPLLGWGFDASRSIPQEHARLSANMEIMPLHPHSLALQTRLELGVPGVLLLAAILVQVLTQTARRSCNRQQSGTAIATALGWLFVANVSYGMWQSWWIATAFLLVVLMRQAIADPADEDAKTADSPGS